MLAITCLLAMVSTLCMDESLEQDVMEEILEEDVSEYSFSPFTQAIKDNDITALEIVLQDEPNPASLLNKTYAIPKSYTALGEPLEASSNYVTPLIEAIIATNAQDKGDVLKKIKIINFLINKGADIEMQSKDYKDYETGTPLAWATFRGLPYMVALLLKKGAQVDAPNSEGVTPLMEIAFVNDKNFEKNVSDAADLLLQYKAQINATDISNDNAFTLALENNNPRSALWLFQKGSSAGITDINNIINTITNLKNDAGSSPEELQSYIHLLDGIFQRFTDLFQFPREGIPYLSQQNKNFLAWFKSGASTQNLSSKDALELAKTVFLMGPTKREKTFNKLLLALKREHLEEMLSTMNDAQIMLIVTHLIENFTPKDVATLWNALTFLQPLTTNNQNIEVIKNIYVYAQSKKKRSITTLIIKLLRPKLMDAELSDQTKEDLIAKIRSLPLSPLLKPYMIEFVKYHGTEKGPVWKDAIFALSDDEVMAIFSAAQDISLSPLIYTIGTQRHYADIIKTMHQQKIGQKRSGETDTTSQKETRF